MAPGEFFFFFFWSLYAFPPEGALGYEAVHRVSSLTLLARYVSYRSHMHLSTSRVLRRSTVRTVHLLASRADHQPGGGSLVTVAMQSSFTRSLAEIRHISCLN